MSAAVDHGAKGSVADGQGFFKAGGGLSVPKFCFHSRFSRFIEFRRLGAPVDRVSISNMKGKNNKSGGKMRRRDSKQKCTGCC